jgi:hypothetical protein
LEDLLLKVLFLSQVMLGLRVQTQQTTFAMYQFGTAVQTTMIKSVIGIALVAISALIGRIVELRGQLAAVSGNAKAMEDVAKSSAKLGDIGGTKEAVGNIKDRLETYKKLKKELQSVHEAAFNAFMNDPLKEPQSSCNLAKSLAIKRRKLDCCVAMD